MRPRTHRLLLLAFTAATAASAPAFGQQGAATPPSQEIDPCTGKPRQSPAGPSASGNPSQDGPALLGTPMGATPSAGTSSAANPAQPSASASAATPSAGTQTGNPSAATQGAGSTSSTSASSDSPQGERGRFSNLGAGMEDTTVADRNRRALRLGTPGLPNRVRLGPAASVSVPTAFGVDAGEVFMGIGYQGRTRYTEEDDAAAVAGVGIGKRSVVALEVALTSYSTLRGAPLETGGLSFKVHRALPSNTSVAVGWENAVRWGGSDDEGSLYGVATRVFSLKDDPADPFSMAVFTLGVGNGRFRFEEDDADDKQTVNLFAAAGVRVAEPVSLVADWTGQDLNVAASFTPIPRVPLVLTTGLADLTGSAGDGMRFILSLGYGTSFRVPLQ
jgi:hypothetical protein